MGLHLFLELSCQSGSEGHLSVANILHCADRKCQARLSPKPCCPQTLLNSAGQEHRWGHPDRQPSRAHGTFITIN